MSSVAIDRVLVMGVAGCGKTLIAGRLASELGGVRPWRFVEADAFHSAGSRAKMSRGDALDDADRWPWLAAVRGAADAVAEDDAAGRGVGGAAAAGGVVVACSALKRAYRERLIGGAAARWAVVLLEVSAEESRRRVETRSARGEHFMPVSLVASQFAALERPTDDEAGLVMRVDAEAAPGDVVRDVAAAVRTRRASEAR